MPLSLIGLCSLLAILHALAAATWLGAMVYSFAVLHLHALRYFGQEARIPALVPEEATTQCSVLRSPL